MICKFKSYQFWRIHADDEIYKTCSGCPKRTYLSFIFWQIIVHFNWCRLHTQSFKYCWDFFICQNRLFGLGFYQHRIDVAPPPYRQKSMLQIFFLSSIFLKYTSTYLPTNMTYLSILHEYGSEEDDDEFSTTARPLNQYPPPLVTGVYSDQVQPPVQPLFINLVLSIQHKVNNIRQL